jgi:hypothetical protein
VGVHLGHLRTLLRLFSLLLVQESKRAKIVGQMMQHPALLAQLCAVAGGRGQCNEQLQEDALALLQPAAAKPPPKAKSEEGKGGKAGARAPLVNAILDTTELLAPLLQGLTLRPIRPASTLALLQLHTDLTQQVPTNKIDHLLCCSLRQKIGTANALKVLNRNQSSC